MYPVSLYTGRALPVLLQVLLLLLPVLVLVLVLVPLPPAHGYQWRHLGWHLKQTHSKFQATAIIEGQLYHACSCLLLVKMIVLATKKVKAKAKQSRMTSKVAPAAAAAVVLVLLQRPALLLLRLLVLVTIFQVLPQIPPFPPPLIATRHTRAACMDMHCAVLCDRDKNGSASAGCRSQCTVSPTDNQRKWWNPRTAVHPPLGKEWEESTLYHFIILDIANSEFRQQNKTAAGKSVHAVRVYPGEEWMTTV